MSMEKKSKSIPLSALEGIDILFPNDLYDLAKFLLKADDAKVAGTPNRSRHTLYGLAKCYQRLCNIDGEAISEVLVAHGLSVGDVIEWE